MPVPWTCDPGKCLKCAPGGRGLRLKGNLIFIFLLTLFEGIGLGLCVGWGCALVGVWVGVVRWLGLHGHGLTEIRVRVKVMFWQVVHVNHSKRFALP